MIIRLCDIALLPRTSHRWIWVAVRPPRDLSLCGCVRSFPAGGGGVPAPRGVWCSPVCRKSQTSVLFVRDRFIVSVVPDRFFVDLAAACGNPRACSRCYSALSSNPGSYGVSRNAENRQLVRCFHDRLLLHNPGKIRNTPHHVAPTFK